MQVKKSVSAQVYLADFRLGFAVNVILLVFFTLFFAMDFYHHGVERIAITDLALLSFPGTFMLATALGLVRYVPLVRYVSQIASADFMVLRRKDSYELDCFCHGRVYRCTFADGFSFVRRGKGVRVYRDDTPCELDVGRLEAYFAEEGERL